MKKLASLILALLAAAALLRADDPPPDAVPPADQPVVDPQTPPVQSPAAPVRQPVTAPPPVLATNAPGTPRFPTAGAPAFPRQFPRPAGATNPAGRFPLPGPGFRPPGTGGANPVAGAATPVPDAAVTTTNTVTNASGDSTDIINFKNMPLDQFLDEYSTISKRTVLRAANLPLQSQVNFRPAVPLTPEERLQMYDTILALNGITMIPTGEKAVLAVPSQQALQEGAAFANKKVEEYSEASQFVTHVIKVRYINVLEAAETLKQFAKNQNGILALETTKTLILRDYAINVKRMLEVLARIDVEVASEYQFEVIPIKFGKVEELYQTLSSIVGGGGGGGLGALGGRGGRGGGGLGGRGGGGLGGSGSSSLGASRSSYNQGGYNTYTGQSEGMEPLVPQQAAVTRAPTTGGAAAGSFQQRFNNVNRAGGLGQAQPMLGDASITPDPRSNSLIVYASKKDMAQIKKIVEKVDTLLAQVLIEGVIMEVGLTSGLTFGVSAQQHYTQYNPNVGGVGNMDNLHGFSGLTNLFPSLPTAGGLNYLLRLNTNYDILVQALASDANVNVLQRPRIITSHAVEASFFAGSTIPFIQGSYNGIGSVGGTSSYYERQDVGVELDVIPYITPDGLVVMEVSQRIEEIAPNNGGIQTGANAPVTDKRQASSTISVRSGEAVLLGGFVRASKSKSNSGVPILKDIPLLGYLFRTTSVDKARTELMILMRPTVLPTPKSAAELTKQYQQDSPQIRMMEHDFTEEREKLNRTAQRQLDASEVKVPKTPGSFPPPPEPQPQPQPEPTPTP